MKLIRTTWIRVIISFLGGGFLTELIHVSTGDPNRPRTTNLSLLYAVVIFVLLTIVVRRSDKKTF